MNVLFLHFPLLMDIGGVQKEKLQDCVLKLLLMEKKYCWKAAIQLYKIQHAR